MMNRPMLILGIMSGSSLDGLDLALCHFSGLNNEFTWHLEDTMFCEFPREWKNRLGQLASGTANELAEADYDFSYLMADKILDFLKGRKIDYLASHGHTIFHHPEKNSTCQIGNGGALAGATNIPVICDFRSTDMSRGGQGAPIVALFDRWFFPEFPFLINIGGIVNITINQTDSLLRAFDIGPGNQLLNYLAEKIGLPFDDEGKEASKGEILPDLLNHLLSVDYFKRKGAKTLDNSELRKLFFLIFDAHNGKNTDKLRTAVELIVQSIRNSLLCNLTKVNSDQKEKIMVSGGGAKNTFLVQKIISSLPEFEIIIPDNLIIDFKEAIMIAFMGYLRLNEKHNVLGSVTGAKRDSIGGAVYLA